MTERLGTGGHGVHNQKYHPMGREIRCMAEVGDWVGQGRLLLETDDLIFRGAQRAVVPRASIRAARAQDGWLVVEHERGTDRFDLGHLAESWARAITNPRTRIDKLDVKPASRIAVIGVADEDFLAELRQRAAAVEVSDAAGNVDLLFYAVGDVLDLERLPALRQRIVPAGAIWLIHPKGDSELKHEPIVAAAKRAGLIDTKTARFSATHTALKLVVPRAARPKHS
jgi:hypothetical protein